MPTTGIDDMNITSDQINAIFLLFVLCGCSVAAFQLPQFQRARRTLSTNAQLSDANHVQAPLSMKKQNKLDSCIEISLEEGKEVVLLVDSNNVRGRDDFIITNSDLLSKLKRWRRSRFPNVNILCVVDHGSKPSAFQYDGLGLIVFAGPNRTADDVIAQGTRWFVPADEDDIVKEKDLENVNVFVVTSDGELKMRCLGSNRTGKYKRKKRKNARVKVFGSRQLLECLEILDMEDSKASTQGADDSKGPSTLQLLLETEISRLEKDIRYYEYKRPPWTSHQEQLEAQKSGPWKSAVLRCDSSNVFAEVPFPMKSFDENTWHRVLIAENTRRMLQRLPSSTSFPSQNTLLSEYQSFYNQGVSSLDAITLFQDHRIKFKPFLQQRMLQYLDQAVASRSRDNETVSSLSGETTTVSFRSPAESSADFLRIVIEQSPGKIQDQILSRYMNEAPSHLQFSRKQDLRDLMLLVAARERREGDVRPHWYLLPETRMENWYVQPGGSRHGKQRGNRRKANDLVVDEALVRIGMKAESRWFDRLKWPMEFDTCVRTR